MRVIICGDRSWYDYAFIFRWVEQLLLNHQEIHHVLKDYPDGFPPLVIIEGEARGVDMMARVAAEYLGIEVQRFPADWKKYGRKAGPIRNQAMIDEGKPDFIMAFHDNFKNSHGTKNMIEKAKKAGIRYRIFTHKDGLPHA